MPEQTFVSAQEADWQYCLESKTIFVPRRSGDKVELQEDSRKFTFNRAYVHNPWGATLEEQFQTKNVTDTPTKETAVRVGKRLALLFPGSDFNVEEERQNHPYRSNYPTWAVVLTSSQFAFPLRFAAGVYAKYLIATSWHAFRQNIKEVFEGTSVANLIDTNAAEPKD